MEEKESRAHSTSPKIEVTEFYQEKRVEHNHFKHRIFQNVEPIRKVFLLGCSVLVAVTVVIIFLNVNKAKGKQQQLSRTRMRRMIGAIRNCNKITSIRTANVLYDHMDMSADPCQDFARYSCGQYEKNTPVTPGDTFTHIMDRGAVVLRNMLQTPSKSNEPDHVLKLKTFYQACTDQDTIKSKGYSRYLHTAPFNQWPSILRDWYGNFFDLQRLLLTQARVFMQPFFHISIQKSGKEQYLVLEPPSFTVPVARLAAGGRWDASVKMYQAYYEIVAVELGGDENVARHDSKRVSKLETTMARAVLDNSSGNVETSLAELDFKLKWRYYQIKYVEVIQTLFKVAGVPMPADIKVLVKNIKYFNQLEQIIFSHEIRTIQNYASWKYAEEHLKYYGEAMKLYTNNFLEASDISSEPMQENWKFCVDKLRKRMERSLMSLFFSDVYKEKQRKQVRKLFNFLKQEFVTIINNTGWLNKTSKSKATALLKSLKLINGNTDGPRESDHKLNSLYSKYSFSLSDHYSNNALMKLDERIESSKFRMISKEKQIIVTRENNALENDAFYDSKKNAIGLPAVLIQSPIYNPFYPKFMKIASIGWRIARSIALALDDSTGKGGPMWMDPEEKIEFEKKLSELASVSNYLVQVLDRKIDGNRTKHSNFHDIIGLQAAYNLFERLNMSTAPVSIPGVYLSPKQLFFIAFGISQCTVYTNKNYIMELNGEHMPSPFRIRSVIRNSPSFVEAFYCVEESEMNPVFKEQVFG